MAVAGDVVSRSETAERQGRKFERLDAVAVVGQVVEDATTGVRAERFDHDHEVGVEVAYDPRDVEPLTAECAEAADAPVGVERGEREIGQTISVSENEANPMPMLKCRCAVPTTRGGRWDHRGIFPSSWRA